MVILVLAKFGMMDCHPGNTSIVKGDIFSPIQCPKNMVEKKEVQRILYASVVGSLMILKYVRAQI